MKRRTHTSAEVKNRWNAQHYDRVAIIVPTGGREELQALAEEQGQSVSAYIRALVIRDAQERGKTLECIGGGGVADRWQECREAALRALGML